MVQVRVLVLVAKVRDVILLIVIKAPSVVPNAVSDTRATDRTVSNVSSYYKLTDSVQHK